MDEEKAKILEKVIQEQAKTAETVLKDPTFAHLHRSGTILDPSYQRKTKENIQELERFLGKLSDLPRGQKQAIAEAISYAMIQVRLLEQGMRESGYYIDAVKDYLHAAFAK